MHRRKMILHSRCLVPYGLLIINDSLANRAEKIQWVFTPRTRHHRSSNTKAFDIADSQSRTELSLKETNARVATASPDLTISFRKTKSRMANPESNFSPRSSADFRPRLIIINRKITRNGINRDSHLPRSWTRLASFQVFYSRENWSSRRIDVDVIEP